MPAPELDFIHRFVPAQEAGRPFTLLLLHGTGGDENDLIPVGRAIAPGAALLSPRGKVLENGRPRFFRRFAEGVFDIEDLTLRAGELANFIPAAAARYGFDPAKAVAAGYSNGANIAAAALLLSPQSLAGAVLFRALVPLQPSTLPDMTGKPILILAGASDPIVPPEESERLAELLGHAGAEVTLKWTRAGHELAAEDVAAARGWLARWEGVE